LEPLLFINQEAAGGVLRKKEKIAPTLKKKWEMKRESKGSNDHRLCIE
jgi:hypothetical protein